MSDWQKDLNDFNEGFTNSPASRMSYNRLNTQMQMGRRAAGHDQPDSQPQSGKGDFVLKMVNGKQLFVGHEFDDDGTALKIVRKHGKGSKTGRYGYRGLSTRPPCARDAERAA